MAMTIHVDIVSAEEAIYSGLAELVIVPAAEGDVGIAARHAPLLTRLKPGEVRVKVDNKETLPFYVSGGILEVQPHVVSVLADKAIRAKDIDEAAAQEAKRRAEEALTDKSGKRDLAKVQLELTEALEQLKTLERWRKNR
ncbi:F0F1 ATP synthase subunit epsilon [Methylococcus sp. EFPC2]|uniref:F0F1 ATP synthase subunit epsilon n=1 Tax=Methylococcus sp. EFPC2 TaxID=2812648 RepID=UPI001966F6E6|nr:F0F1 ATP synthase subunit epsilon [Methylococcus sp. EFPC2]QSA96077.1 F0F1 ATP synthase subunit epsilon [Methylococcus sp. EFPC2]